MSKTFGKLFLAFTLIPLIELYLLMAIASATSALTAIGLVLFTGAVGAMMAKREGPRAWQAIKNELQEGNLPADQLIEGLAVLIGGVLLVTPGIITDAFGFTLLLPLTRRAYVRLLRKYFKERVLKDTHIVYHRSE